MSYLTSILAFLVAILAIVGNTWDSSKEGASRLTATGRAALGLALLTLLFSLTATREQNAREHARELDRARLAKIVQSEVALSLKYLLSPFRQLYIETHSGQYIAEESISIDIMLREENLALAQDVCLALRPTTFSTFPDSGTWDDIFDVGVTSGIGRLDRIVDRYGMRVNAELLDAIQDLQTNGHFSWYARTPPRGTIPESEDGSGGLPPCVLGQATDSHKQYLTMLKRIEQLNNPATIALQ